MDYDKVLKYDIDLYNRIYKELGNTEKAWEKFFEEYKDPDRYIGKGCKEIEGVMCRADALLSVKRIHAMEKFGEDFITAFKRYRNFPIFYFPCEVWGINTSRAVKLEDRIDYTILDIKLYYEEKDCVLQNVYEKNNTKKWLEKLGDFQSFVDTMGIKGSFVSCKYEVFDILKFNPNDIGNSKKLENHKDKYKGVRSKEYITAWEKEYYDNLKKIMDIYYKKNRIKTY